MSKKKKENEIIFNKKHYHDAIYIAELVDKLRSEFFKTTPNDRRVAESLVRLNTMTDDLRDDFYSIFDDNGRKWGDSF